MKSVDYQFLTSVISKSGYRTVKKYLRVVCDQGNTSNNSENVNTQLIL